MARQEHVHIITAGKAIYSSFAATVRDHPDITHAYVFADTGIYSNDARDDAGARAGKEETREAVTKVRDLSASLKMPSSLVYVSPPADASVRDAVLKIRKERPDARFSFDLTAGSKDMCLALFGISLWVGGEAYYAFGGPKKEPHQAKLAVPKIPAENIVANQNYVKILRTLAYAPGKQEPSARVLPRSYLFNQLSGFYVPVRSKGVKIAENRTGKTDLYTGKKAVLYELSQGTCSSFLNTLAGWDMIEEVPGLAGNRKEKYYRITSCGELALRLAEIKPGTVGVR